MGRYLIIPYILFLSTALVAQKHSVGVNLNAIHNFNYVDKDFDDDETVKLPLHILQSYGIEYTYTLQNNFGLHSSLSVLYIGTRIAREFEARRTGGQYVIHRRRRAFNSQTPSLRFGGHWSLNILNLHIGLNIRYIAGANVGKFGASVFENESYTPVAEFENIENKSKLHASIYLNLDYRIAKIRRNELRVNFIGNLGLHPIYRTTSIIENFDNNIRKEIVHNNFGTYIGLGIKVVRSSDKSISDLFKFKNSK